jgi:hypothetical protein
LFHSSGNINDLWCDIAEPYLCEADPLRTSYDVATLPIPLFVDDFDQGSGELDQTKWLVTRTGGDETATLSGQAALLDLGADNGANHEIQLIALGQPSVANAELSLTFQFGEADTGRDLRIYMKGSGGWEGDGNDPLTGYGIHIGAGDGIELASQVAGAKTSLATGTFVPGTEQVHLRMQCDAAGVRAKLWTEGDGGGEPGAWTLTSLDNSLTDPGKIYITAFNTVGSNHTVVIDDVQVVDLGP